MYAKFCSSLIKRPKADVFVIPYVIYRGKPKIAIPEKIDSSETHLAIKCGDFSGNQGEHLTLYSDSLDEKRLTLLGLGEMDEVTVESLRRAYASLVKDCNKKKIATIMTFLPDVKGLKDEQVARGVAEGMTLANYHFIKNKSKSDSSLLKGVYFVSAKKTAQTVIKDTLKLSGAVHFSRDLVNDNADVVTPQHLIKCARALSKKYAKVSSTIFDKKRLAKEKMGLILAVNRGSARDPALIMMKYRGNPKSKDHTVIVGKGVTYDTGGLNLKPTGSMETMRCDMGGAASVFGIMEAVASLGLKVNITGVVPTTENGIDAHSYKPGDVYKGFLGKTVEIGNTDAEGRLILADALAYASKKLKPTRIIDFATLTGAIVIALGHVTTGLMSNNDQLSESLSQAGEDTYERVWRLPIFDEYKKQLKSDIADIKNTGGRGGGSITAALFLKEFVGDVPWAHLDIAGTAFLNSADGYNPKHATGVGVRLVVEFLKQLK
jgi:leucyl aminopeptidase